MRRVSLKLQIVAGAVLPAFLLLSLNPSQAFAVMRAQRAEHERQIALARQLGMDPAVLLTPEEYQRKEAVRAEKRRVDAVAAMRSRTGADPAKLAALAKTVREVEDAHAIHAVAGLADDVTDLQHAVERAHRDPGAAGTIVALERAPRCRQRLRQ